jgi:hypothetical protein
MVWCDALVNCYFYNRLQSTLDGKTSVLVL